MADRAQIMARAQSLRAGFQAAGALAVDLPILQPAGTLLDLYGEDIRARAYVTQDPLRGEQMLRPDFTVPVVQMHMQSGASSARYTYMGEVFRKQEDDPSRASEYIQVGFELFDRDNIPRADAETFVLFAQALRDANLQAQTGDIGLLMAAVRGLQTTDRRRAALMRHIWRPRKFRALLDRFSGRTPARVRDFSAPAAPHIGLRGPDEIAQRIEWLAQDAAAAPICATDLALIERLLSISAPYDQAMRQLGDLAKDLPAIAAAVELATARGQAMQAQGVDLTQLPFATSFGRSTMEYYDGFVFGFAVMDQADWPLVASGGRYDALTRHLGQTRDIPAIGGVIRPGLLLELEGAV